MTLTKEVLDAMVAKLCEKYVHDLALAVQAASAAGASLQDTKDMGLVAVVAMLEASAMIANHLPYPYEKYVQLAACAGPFGTLTPGQQSLHDVIHQFVRTGIDQVKVGFVGGHKAREMLKALDDTDTIDKLVERASVPRQSSDDKPN